MKRLRTIARGNTDTTEMTILRRLRNNRNGELRGEKIKSFPPFGLKNSDHGKYRLLPNT